MVVVAGVPINVTLENNLEMCLSLHYNYTFWLNEMTYSG